jgi:hypothetical protein
MFRQASKIVVVIFALSALCVQFAVSFGHVHLRSDHGLVEADAHIFGSEQSGGQLPNHDDDEHDCPICQLLSLVASAVIPLPPEMAAPALSAAKNELPCLVQFATAITAHDFQARAPPQV